MIYIGSDHAGLSLKETIKTYFESNNIKYIDVNLNVTDSACDYPDIALKLCDAVTKDIKNIGILVCGTGVGMAIAANKIRGIRAVCASDSFSVKYSRLHNNANVLCLGGRVIGGGLGLELVNIFLNVQFEGGRHIKRLDKIKNLESC